MACNHSITSYRFLPGLTSAFLLCLMLHAQAGYSVTGSLGRLTDSSGTELADGRLVVLVVDLLGDGVSAPTTTDFAPGSDDHVLGTYETSSFGTPPSETKGIVFETFRDQTVNVGSLDLSVNPLGLAEGDALSVFWYPDLIRQDFLDDPNLEPGDTSYGSYNADSQDTAWIMPGDAGTTTLKLTTEDLGGPLPDDEASAQLLRALNTTGGGDPGPVVPEPSSALLLLLSSGLLFLRRTRRT